MKFGSTMTAILLVSILSTSLADGDREARAIKAHSLLAFQLYTEMRSSLSQQLAETGQNKEQVDYLVFRITLRIALCSTHQFVSSGLPQIQFYVSLLATEPTRSSVTFAMKRMYSEDELAEMERLIGSIRNGCQRVVYEEFGLTA